MARDLSGRIMIGGILAAAIALGVTAAVTSSMAQSAGIYAPTITNLNTKRTFAWTRHAFPSQQTCDAALGNLPEFLAAVRDPNPDVKVAEPTGDKDLVEDVTGAVVQLFMNTGVLPNLSISCEAQGDPA